MKTLIILAVILVSLFLAIGCYVVEQCLKDQDNCLYDEDGFKMRDKKGG